MSFRPPPCRRVTRSGWICWVLLAGLALLVADLPAAAPSHDKPSAKVDDPGTDLWRFVRRRAPELRSLAEKGAIGPVTTQVKGVDTSVLINDKGQEWRLYRHRMLIPISAIVLGTVAVLLLLLYLAVGRRVPDPRETGKRLLRFVAYERTLHWFMAAIFLFLGVTGLTILYGRPLLIPLVGKESFSAMASASKEGHNLFGPLFLVSLLLFLQRFWRRNLYSRGDLRWLIRLGGLLGGDSPPAGFFNMGEKMLFWLLIAVGLLICASGLVLLFPNFGQGRLLMEGAHLIHTLGAVLLLATIMAHIYMGIATKGAMDGMKGGYVEYSWARHHHREWADEEEKKGRVLSEEEVRRRFGEARKIGVPEREAGT